MTRPRTAPDEVPGLPPTDWQRQEARDFVAQRLGLLSMAIWVVGMLAFMFLVFPVGAFKPSSGMFVGMALLALAALPWLAYWRLVEEVARRRARQ